MRMAAAACYRFHLSHPCVGVRQSIRLRSGLCTCAAAPPSLDGPLTREAAEQEMSHQFKVLSEEKVYGRYLSVYDRKIQFTSRVGETTDVHYDIVGHPKSNFLFTVVLPFHPAVNGTGPQVTLIREYCQGPNAMAYCLPSGCFDPNKHSTMADCAKAELSEEALLQGGQLVRLIPEDHPGMSEVKWCANKFVPFLAIDPQPDPQPGRRDVEEVMVQAVRVSMEELRAIIAGGDMMLPSIATCHLAFEVLRERGLLP